MKVEIVSYLYFHFAATLDLVTFELEIDLEIDWKVTTEMDFSYPKPTFRGITHSYWMKSRTCTSFVFLVAAILDLMTFDREIDLET